MNIVWYELRKIIMVPALIGLIAVSLLLNIIVISTMRNSYADYIADVSRETGIRLGAEFDERAAGLEAAPYADLLRAQTYGMANVLDGYTTDHLAEGYIEMLGLNGLPADLMRNKYKSFQSAVDARFYAGDAMTLYFANATFSRHEMLFDYVMGLLLFQGIILAALIMLLTIGYEIAANTDYVVYSTRTGRRVNRHKLIAGIIAGIGVYTLLAAFTLSLYFAFNPMGGTWGSSVSSGYNFIQELSGARPFVTWHGFTVFGYLLASIGVSLGLVLCFALMGYVLGLWVKNSYIGFLIIVAVNMVMFILPFYSRIWMLNFTITQSPIFLVMMRALWFTDGGSNVVLPHFETVGIVGAFMVLAVIGHWSASRFKKRNLT